MTFLHCTIKPTKKSSGESNALYTLHDEINNIPCRKQINLQHPNLQIIFQKATGEPLLFYVKGMLKLY